MIIQKTAEVYTFRKGYSSTQEQREYEARIDVEYRQRADGRTRMTIKNEHGRDGFSFIDSDPALAEAVASLIQQAAIHATNTEKWNPEGKL